MPEQSLRFLIDNNVFISATKSGWTGSTNLLYHLLDGPYVLVGDEILCFEYNKWAKILGVHDLLDYLKRRVIINNPSEGELSRCVAFSQVMSFQI